MTLAEAVRAVVVGHMNGVPSFWMLFVEVRLLVGDDATATEIDKAARPYEVGRPGAYRYEREDGPGHCPCQSDVDDIEGGHIASCLWSDENYSDGDDMPL